QKRTNTTSGGGRERRLPNGMAFLAFTDCDPPRSMFAVPAVFSGKTLTIFQLRTPSCIAPRRIYQGRISQAFNSQGNKRLMDDKRVAASCGKVQSQLDKIGLVLVVLGLPPSTAGCPLVAAGLTPAAVVLGNAATTAGRRRRLALRWPCTPCPDRKSVV